MLKNEKGQSLVEVTVALTVLAIVLYAVVTLGIQSVSLMINSRQRTEATAIAQKQVENFKREAMNGCTAKVNTISGFSTGIYTVEYKLEDTSSFSSPDYALLTVKVTWKGKLGGDTDLIIQENIRRK